MRATMMGVLIATMFGSAACYSLQPVSLEHLSANRAARVWVTHPNQSVMLMQDAQVFRGKLVGFVEGQYRELAPADLQKLRVRKLAAARTTGLIVAGVAGFAAVVVLVSGGEDHFDPCAGDEDCVET